MAKNNDALDTLSQFIKRNYLLKIQIKAQLRLGLIDSIKDIQEVLEPNELL
jgi:hypothetical protein